MKKTSPGFKDTFLWSLKIYGASWLAMVICTVPLYIFRGFYPSDPSRLIWEELLMSVLGIAVTAIILLLFSKGTDEFEKAEPQYVKKLAIRSSLIYGVICTLSLGYYPICVIISHFGRFIAYLFGFPTIIIPLVFASAIANVIFALAIIKGSSFARNRHEKKRAEILGDKYKQDNDK